MHPGSHEPIICNARPRVHKQLYKPTHKQLPYTSTLSCNQQSIGHSQHQSKSSTNPLQSCSSWPSHSRATTFLWGIHEEKCKHLYNVLTGASGCTTAAYYSPTATASTSSL
ncbi:hypothetical protein BY996DRAFT_6569531 [Phakopsora pachyrhizi]|uniref:Uncharacterized protein n=1 Tax=Phakopsora pachyrhizi TaxID=170000 RepID=A0AAV0AVR4_PHAPC|nr:hypothetical protein BY996DRAFT_6569531 [Phakopsora pachyrhizi]CAH7672370.1 hypothetical protein PPACK8108_LOCUS7169 [Phakopsora pachyrhizi]